MPAAVRSAPSLPTKPPEQFPVPALGFLLTVILSGTPQMVAPPQGG